MENIEKLLNMKFKLESIRDTVMRLYGIQWTEVKKPYVEIIQATMKALKTDNHIEAMLDVKRRGEHELNDHQTLILIATAVDMHKEESEA
jgi:hypothetical protein